MRRLLVISAALLCAFVAAGCGNKQETVTLGETEGIYLDIDDLKYQVQISRYMNPNDVEDRSYLLGLPSSTSQPGGDETWFGVFIRVQNTTDETIAPANDFMIVDTQENKYRPIPIDTNVNPFAYKPDPIPPKGLIPEPDSAASDTTIQGSLLLFKVKTESLQNRPLEFRFKRGSGTEGVVDLDV
jgi:outer membrane protein assembly factor BamE (lipoprotein component of BamABCDE complex)